MDLKLDHPVMRAVFASISPGGGRDTFVPLRRLLLAQAPPRDANAGPPIITGLIILTQEQLLNMEVICAALETQLSVANMKIVERSSPAVDGSAAGVAHLHSRQKLSRQTSPWASCRSIPMAPGRRA